MNWFECKVSYEKTMENGSQKKVTEPYLLDALSYTEAELRIIEEIKPYVSAGVTIYSIARARIAEMFFNASGDRYFRAKVQFITLEEKSGTEKRQNVQMLVQASDIRHALDVLEEGMKKTMADYVVIGMTETAIVDIFPFAAPDTEGDKKSQSKN